MSEQAEPTRQPIHPIRRYRMPIIAACVAMILVAYLLHYTEAAPSTIAIFFKVLPVSVLILCMPWIRTRPMLSEKTAPRATARALHIVYWVLIGFAVVLAGLTLATAFGINCTPQPSEIFSGMLWGINAIALLVLYPFYRRWVGKLLKSQANAFSLCYACGYDLRQISSPACPECGHQYEPSGPRHDGDAPPAVN